MTEIGIDLEKDAVLQDGKIHPIMFGGEVNPNDEYKMRLYSFTDEQGGKADGCVFEIAPHGSSTVMRVVDQRVKIQEIAIKGKGWFMGVNPEGEMIVQEVGEGLEENPQVDQKEGWVGVWIAGPEGMEVLDITTPPFDPSMEVAVARDDVNMPSQFWTEYEARKQNRPNI